ncbi:hypothetical protein [Weissella paramesenteroides]|nr:hypothetical protein [Weissella paramesenteroides]
MQQLHWSLSDVDDEDFEELMAVLSANENEKMIDPLELAKQFM